MANPHLKADLKGYLGITGTTDDALLDSLLESVWERMRGYTGRKLESVSQTFFRVWPGNPIVLPDYPIASITSVTIDDVALNSDDFQLLDNGMLYLKDLSEEATDPAWIKVVFVGGIVWTVAGEGSTGNFPQDLLRSGYEYGSLLYWNRKHSESRIGVTSESQVIGTSRTYETNGIPDKIRAVWDRYKRHI